MIKICEIISADGDRGYVSLIHLRAFINDKI